MFTHQTILSLRANTVGTPASLPVFGHFRDYHFARNVMEAKQYLLRCVRGMNRGRCSTPDFVLVDAGSDNDSIRSELERWLEEHPRLGRVRVKHPARRPWFLRGWKIWNWRQGGAAASN